MRSCDSKTNGAKASYAIELIGPDKAVAVHSLLHAANEMMKQEGLYHWDPLYPLDAIKADTANKRVYLVTLHDEPVATYTLAVESGQAWTNTCTKNAIYLSKLAVLPSCSGHGVGRWCLERIEEVAANQGYDTIRLDVYDKSCRAIRFYQHKGFRVVGSARTRRFTVLKMEKTLSSRCGSDDSVLPSDRQLIETDRDNPKVGE